MIINGDDFRFLHPDFNYIYQTYGDDFVTHTAKFSGETVERAIERAIVGKLNIVVEGTFRNAATPLQTLKTQRCRLPNKRHDKNHLSDGKLGKHQ